MTRGGGRSALRRVTVLLMNPKARAAALVVAVAVLAGCAGIFLLAWFLAEQPRIDATWKASADGDVRLACR